MSFQIVTNQMAFCNCQQASYEYEFIIVQLQADCIIFIGLYIYFFFSRWPGAIIGFKSCGNQVIRVRGLVFAVTI